MRRCGNLSSQDQVHEYQWQNLRFRTNRDSEGMTRAMARAIRAAVREHKLLGFPIVVWQDGKVVEIPPEEIVLEDEDDEPRMT